MPFDESKVKRTGKGMKGGGEFASKDATGAPVDPKAAKPRRRASPRVRVARRAHNVVTSDGHKYAEQQHASVARALGGDAATGPVDVAVPNKDAPPKEEPVQAPKSKRTYAVAAQLRGSKEQEEAQKEIDDLVGRNTPVGTFIKEARLTHEGAAPMKPTELLAAGRAALRQQVRGEVSTHDAQRQAEARIAKLTQERDAAVQGKQEAEQKVEAATVADTTRKTQEAETAKPPAPLPRDKPQHLGPRVEATVDQLTKDAGITLDPPIKFGSVQPPDVVAKAYNTIIGIDPVKFRQTLLADIPFDPKSPAPSITLSGIGDRMTVEIKGRLEGGSEIKIKRSFRDGGRVVSHEEFGIHSPDDTPPAQGKGIGKAVIRNFLKVYDSTGTKFIIIHANCDVGGYAWARYGFTPDENGWENLKSLVKPRINKLVASGQLSQASKDALSGIMARTAPNAIRDLAALSQPVTRMRSNGEPRDAAPLPLGKAILMGADWGGGIDLNDEASYSHLKSYTAPTAAEKAAGAARQQAETAAKAQAAKQAEADKAAAASVQADPLTRPKVGSLGPKTTATADELKAANLKFSVGTPEKTTEAYNAMVGLDPAVFRKTLLEGVPFATSGDNPEVKLGTYNGMFYVAINGKLADGSIVNLSRRFTDGGKTVNHDNFKISTAGADAAGQGKGVGKQVLGNFLNLYDHMGVTKINVEANCEVGAYAWARYGFVPDNTEFGWDGVRTDVKDRLGIFTKRKLIDPQTEAHVRGLVASDDPTSIRQIAALSLPIPKAKTQISDPTSPGDTVPLGKALLLGGGWTGGINLQDPTSYGYLKSYLGGNKPAAPVQAAPKEADVAAAAVIKHPDIARPAPVPPPTDEKELGWDEAAKASKELEKAGVSVGDPDSVNAYNKLIGMPGEDFRKLLLDGLPLDASDLKGVKVSFSTRYDGHAITVEGTLKDGSELYALRHLSADGKTVDHTKLTIRAQSGEMDKGQGKGVGKIVLGNFLKLYDRLGTQRINVEANIDVGGYAWARYGFTPDAQSWKRLKETVGASYRSLKDAGAITPAARTLIDKVLQSDDATMIRDIAALSEPITHKQIRGDFGPEGSTTLGKALLLGTNWKGGIDLTKPENYSTLKSYIGGEKPTPKAVGPVNKETPLYHFTKAPVFDKFDAAKAGSTTDEGLLGKGIYLTTDKNTNRPGERMIETRVNLKNPLHVQMDKWGGDKAQIVSDKLGLDSKKSGAALTAALTAKGHDGVVMDYSPLGYQHKEVMVVDPDRIEIKHQGQ